MVGKWEQDIWCKAQRKAYSNKEAKPPWWTISSWSVMAENVLGILRECNTMWGIWPLKLCNISRSRCELAVTKSHCGATLDIGTLMSDQGHLIFLKTRAPRCVHTKLWSSALTHRCYIPTSTVVQADRQNKGTGTTSCLTLQGPFIQALVSTKTFGFDISVNGQHKNKNFLAH